MLQGGFHIGLTCIAAHVLPGPFGAFGQQAMTIYWLLFAYPALLALSFPQNAQRGQPIDGQGVFSTGFVLFYALVGGLRYEVGGDWLTYEEMFEDMRNESLGFAMSYTDPLYGLLNWISSLLGTEIYLVNFICCMILAAGVVKAARTLRDPWLAVTIAVPYLLIVVGMGYVRQGASIGLVLMALASLDKARTMLTIGYLVLATGFHSTAVIAFPMFVFALTQRNRGLSLVGTLIGAVLFLFVLVPRLDRFEVGYLDQEYDSGGAMVRVLMGLLPAMLILLRWRRFPASDRVRSVWLMIALANVLAMIALVVSSSSTAVDRIALFVSIIQLAAFGEIRELTGAKARMTPFLRMLMIGVAAAVQVVWLVFATHAEYWVPYNSILFAQ